MGIKEVNTYTVLGAVHKTTILATMMASWNFLTYEMGVTAAALPVSQNSYEDSIRLFWKAP